MCVDHLDPKQMQMFTSEDERGKEKRDLQREVSKARQGKASLFI